MRESGVDADHKLCASNELRNLIQRCTIRDAGSWHGCGNEFTSYPLALRSPGQYQLIPLPKHFAKRDPIRVRPLLFGPCGRVQQKAVARCVLSDFRATDSRSRESHAAYSRAPNRSAFDCARQRANFGRRHDGHRKTAKQGVPERLKHHSRGAGHGPRAREWQYATGPGYRQPRRIVARVWCGNWRGFPLSSAGAYSDFLQRRDATGMTLSAAGCRRTKGANASSTSQLKVASGCAFRASVKAGI